MSPKNSILTTGLTALGLLFGSSALRAADPGEAPAPTGPPPAPASSQTTQMVLLKTNGDLLTGPIREEGGHYVVQKSGGPIPVPKAQVEKTFASIAEVYRYKRTQFPEDDADERFKLARWCLSQNLTAEATAELRAVVAISPGTRDARAMLAKLEASEERVRKPRFDPALVQTGGEATMAAPRPGDSRPAEIDPSTIRRATRDLGVSGLPVIFDLPPALAVKRAEQFARDVHPILQAACVRCHNEQHPGSFQLVEVKSRRGLSGDALRANLDATLRLVDAENPARSELLSSALVPHGNRPNARPIFGSNDRRYQIIAAWVNSLHAPRPTDSVAPTRFAPKETAAAAAPAGEGFAVERVPGQGVVPGVSTTPLLNQGHAPLIDRKELPPMRAVPGQGMVAERQPPDAGEFPAPYLLGGPKPPSNAGPTAAPVPPAPVVPPPAAANPPTDNSLPPLPGTRVVTPTPLPPPAAATARPKTPLKIDPELLERALLNRNNGR